MSFDIYVQGYSESGPDGLSLASILGGFGNPTEVKQNQIYDITYNDNSTCTLYPRFKGQNVVSLTISRPSGHPQFWRGLHQTLSAGPYVAFYPGCPSPICANENVTRYLPEGMVTALGTPVLAETAEQCRLWVVEG